MKCSRAALESVFESLYECHGPRYWWPGDTPFEVMVGAVLTQNTAWSNVEKAIANLVADDLLDPAKIVAVRKDYLARRLKPSGYFNIKAGRLRHFCRWYIDAGGYAALEKMPTDALRQALLSVHGIGPETADDILLYAFSRPVFVIDAYTRRLFSRLGMIAGDEPYEQLRLLIEQALGADAELFNEYHALIVQHAKEICRTRPVCEQCMLKVRCPAAQIC
ncbi:MAG: endonuclease [Gammaproteobacteria bacterium]